MVGSGGGLLHLCLVGVTSEGTVSWQAWPFEGKLNMKWG